MPSTERALYFTLLIKQSLGFFTTIDLCDVIQTSLRHREAHEQYTIVELPVHLRDFLNLFSRTNLSRQKFATCVPEIASILNIPEL